jgi:hypothetical protein
MPKSGYSLRTGNGSELYVISHLSVREGYVPVWKSLVESFNIVGSGTTAMVRRHGRAGRELQPLRHGMRARQRT